MFTLLIVLISLLAVLLCVIILLQAGKGGGLASTFGGASSSTESFMGGRQAATALTRLTWIGGGVFLFLSLVLAVLSAGGSGSPASILREGMGPSQQVPAQPTSILETEMPGTPEEGVSPGTEGGGSPGGGPEDGGQTGGGGG